MNLHFHSNAETCDQGFHSKCTHPTSIYTHDPGDPVMIPLWDHYLPLERTTETRDFRDYNIISTYICVHYLRDPTFWKESGKKIDPIYTHKGPLLFSAGGITKDDPPIGMKVAGHLRERGRCFVIPPRDQGGITGITPFPLEKPSHRSISRRAVGAAEEAIA